MSQNTEKEQPISEDLFTTQDLLENHEDTEEIAPENKQNEVVESLDFDFASEDIADNENIVGNSEEITEDVELEEDIPEEELEEITENIEEESENVEETDQATEEVSELVDGENPKKKQPAKTCSHLKISELPLAKVKHIIKLDPDVKLVNSEAVYLITKATEFFVRTLAKESFSHAAQQKKKTITKNHVDQALTMLPIEMM